MSEHNLMRIPDQILIWRTFLRTTTEQRGHKMHNGSIGELTMLKRERDRRTTIVHQTPDVDAPAEFHKQRLDDVSAHR